VGEPEEEHDVRGGSERAIFCRTTNRVTRWTGHAAAIAELIARGMDMFDCVLPTRLARNGTAFAATGTLNLKNAEFAREKIQSSKLCLPGLPDYTRVHRILSKLRNSRLRLITLHNLHFYLELMRQARAAIENATVNEFRFTIAIIKAELDLCPRDRHLRSIFAINGLR